MKATLVPLQSFNVKLVIQTRRELVVLKQALLVYAQRAAEPSDSMMAHNLHDALGSIDINQLTNE